MSPLDRDFRRRVRPGWVRPSEGEIVPIKRLRGLDEFVAPAFVGRMVRVERWRKRSGWMMVGVAVLIGGLIGWGL